MNDLAEQDKQVCTPLVENSLGLAMKGNKNALRSGTYSFLTTGRWPKGASYVTKLLRGFRREVQKRVKEVHGELGLYHAALVQTACRHEARALLWQRWLREKKDELNIEQLLVITAAICNASDARDRCLKGLDLDRRPDPFGMILNATPVADDLTQNGHQGNGKPAGGVSASDATAGQPGGFPDVPCGEGGADGDA